MPEYKRHSVRKVHEEKPKSQDSSCSFIPQRNQRHPSSGLRSRSKLSYNTAEQKHIGWVSTTGSVPCINPPKTITDELSYPITYGSTSLEESPLLGHTEVTTHHTARSEQVLPKCRTNRVGVHSRHPAHRELVKILTQGLHQHSPSTSRLPGQPSS